MKSLPYLVCTQCGYVADFSPEQREVRAYSDDDVDFCLTMDDALTRNNLSVVCPQCMRTNAWIWCKTPPATYDLTKLREIKQASNN